MILRYIYYKQVRPSFGYLKNDMISLVWESISLSLEISYIFINKATDTMSVSSKSMLSQKLLFFNLICI